MTVPKDRRVFINHNKHVAKMVDTYRAVRTLKIDGEKRWPGELVPEAHTWLRVGNAEHSGYIKLVRVPESEFDQAVANYCPDLAQSLAEKAKGAPVAEKDDTKIAGFRFNEDGQVVDVAAQRRLEKERELASLAPNDRPARYDAGGTPEYMEQNSPDHIHSDGGSTLWSQKAMDDLDLKIPGDGIDEKTEAEEGELIEGDGDSITPGDGGPPPRKDRRGPGVRAHDADEVPPNEGEGK